MSNSLQHLPKWCQDSTGWDRTLLIEDIRRGRLSQHPLICRKGSLDRAAKSGKKNSDKLNR